MSVAWCYAACRAPAALQWNLFLAGYPRQMAAGRGSSRTTGGNVSFIPRWRDQAGDRHVVASFTASAEVHPFHIAGLSDEITGAVRQTRRAPEYGHPVHEELAGGTGPCRACLQQFLVGEEHRLLFTYRPASHDGTLGAPGPVFIHSRECERYAGSTFPPGLRSLPLLFEARASENRVLAARRASGEEIDQVLDELLADERTDYLYLRHGEAGCHIARIDRMGAGGGAPAAAGPEGA
jgi:hypothetical protein